MAQNPGGRGSLGAYYFVSAAFGIGGIPYHDELRRSADMSRWGPNGLNRLWLPRAMHRFRSPRGPCRLLGRRPRVVDTGRRHVQTTLEGDTASQTQTQTQQMDKSSHQRRDMLSWQLGRTLADHLIRQCALRCGHRPPPSKSTGMQSTLNDIYRHGLPHHHHHHHPMP